MGRTGSPPSYQALAATGELADRAQRLAALLAECRICPRGCGVDRRRQGGTGSCGIGAEPVVAACTPHFGEEPIISGQHGSGTVFLAGCNLRCVYCQNHDISQRTPDPAGTTPAASLAERFLELEARGCHNLNWVSPSHQVPQLVGALALAADRGLSLPIVYNTNAYDSVAVLRLLEGIVDIYLPDLRYADPGVGRRLSGVDDYPHHARQAVSEMYRQVGHTWRLGRDGMLRRGLLVRLLVLPNDLAEVGRSLRWIAARLSPRLGISLMAQYYPSHLAAGGERYPLLGRTVSHGEWARALAQLEEQMRGDHHFVQDPTIAPDYYRPDFTDPSRPFKDISDFL